MQLGGLDFDDDATVVAFIEQHGVIRRWWRTGQPDELSGVAHGGVLGDSSQRPRRSSDALDARSSAARRAAARLGRDRIETNEVWDAAQQLRLMALMAAHWRSHEQGGDVRDVWRPHVSIKGERLTPEHVWALWQSYLVAIVPSAGSALAVEFDDGTTLGGAAATVTEVLAVQLFNHVVEGIPARKCADPYCENYFIRQDGGEDRSRARTSGSKYCSTRCKNRSTQREHRHRKQRSERTAIDGQREA
jgi:hypothetical protein